MSNSQRMFIEIRKDRENLKDGRIFKGRGALINHIRNSWISLNIEDYFKRYEILEIVSLTTREPTEDFEELIKNWPDYKEFEKDENPKVIREDNYKDGIGHMHGVASCAHAPKKDYLHEKTSHQNWP